MAKGDLKVHQLTHEMSERNFECVLCQRTFITRDKLVRHRYKVHRMQSKELVCKYCDAAFRSPGVLYSHLTIHTGERPYRCGLCPESFANTTASSIHRRAHLINGKYNCPVCAVEISSKLALYKVHMRDEHDQDVCTFDPIDYNQHIYIRKVNTSS